MPSFGEIWLVGNSVAVDVAVAVGSAIGVAVTDAGDVIVEWIDVGVWSGISVGGGGPSVERDDDAGVGEPIPTSVVGVTRSRPQLAHTIHTKIDTHHLSNDFCTCSAHT